MYGVYGVCGYGVQALGVRMVSVGLAYIWRWRMVALGMRVVSLGVRVYVDTLTWYAYEGYDRTKPSTLNNQSTI